MIIVTRLTNGKLLVPKVAEDKSLNVIGDGLEEIDSSHPDYRQWLMFLERFEAQMYKHR